MNSAIYIDADNVSYKSINEILSYSSNTNILIKKIFADWTNESMKKWAKKSKENGFQGIQCFGNDKKQTSDIYMITEIINDLYNNKFIDMIILATSDIDFTHLCHIIKAKNKKLVIYTPQKSSITNLVSDLTDSPKIDQPIMKKQKINDDKEILNYLTEAMKDSLSIYISKYKKNLKKIVPKNIKGLDINHIDKTLIKYPKYFGLVKKGNKVKIYGLFHLQNYNKKEFIENKKFIEIKYSEIFKNFTYENITKILYQ